MSRIITYIRRLNWIDRLPRPERNGAKGVILMVHLFLSVLYAPLMGVDWPQWLRDHNPIPQAEEAQRDYRHIMLVYGHHPGHGCACRMEYQLKDTAPQYGLDTQYTCGGLDDNVWHPTEADIQNFKVVQHELNNMYGITKGETIFVQICDTQYSCRSYGVGQVRWRWRCE